MIRLFNKSKLDDKALEKQRINLENENNLNEEKFKKMKGQNVLYD